MPNTPTLNERAAKAMGWTARSYRLYSVYRDARGGEIMTVEAWRPSTDYNHAHLLYDRVVGMGLDRRVKFILAGDTAPDEASELSEAWCFSVLDASAAQLTEACVEVIEEHERSKR